MDGVLADFSTMDPMTRWALIVAASLTILYAVMRPMRKKKDPLAKAPASATLASQRAFERDMNTLLVELTEMSRKITAQLDTRTLKLEMLIKEADEKLAALRAAMSSAPTASNGGPHSTEPVMHAAPAAEPAMDLRHMQVYQLADEGRSTAEIAHRLSRPHGEIELILALREKPPAA